MTTLNGFHDRGDAGHEAEASQVGATVSECPVCHGFGFYTVDVLPDHPDFGAAFPCECRKRSHRHRTLERIHALSYLEAVQDKTFSSFLEEPPGYSKAARESLREAHRICRAFADRPNGWILLAGITGCGKTHLASAIANERAAAETPVLMLTVPSLLDRLRATFAPDAPQTFSEVYNLVESVDVLVLDDLGAQSSTPWATEKLFQLLNERHVRQLPTVVTTNLSLWEFEPRLQSRLKDVHLVHQVHINAPDYRVWVHRSSNNASGLGGGTWPDLNSLDLHQTETFYTFNPRKVDGRSNHDHLVGICRKLENWLAQPQGWRVLVGASGSGKTHLAAALANKWNDNGGQVLFVAVEDLKDYFRRTIQVDAAAAARGTNQIRQVSFLVLDGFDDLGELVRRGSGWTERRLRSLLEYRFDAELPTVITTSHTKPEHWEDWFFRRAHHNNKSEIVRLVDPPAKAPQL